MATRQPGSIVPAGGENSIVDHGGRRQQSEILITLDEVCQIFHRTKRQIFNYRQQGLPDYGGRPVMFDRNAVALFLLQRRQQKKSPAATRKILEQHRGDVLTDKIAKRLLNKGKK